MKLIISRKGFDAANGCQASPILPDGTLLSLPIPTDWDIDNSFSTLTWNGLSYYDIIRQLKPRSKMPENQLCHLDPDLRKDVRPRADGWKPAFGQMENALTVLRNNHVGVGDLFLFFGWFKQTEYHNGKLRYVRYAPDLHVIYGYMQVGEIIEQKAQVPTWLEQHPHVAYDESWKRGRNTIYIAADNLSFAPNICGAGTLNFRDDRVLTKPGCSRSKWLLPDFFRKVEISQRSRAWQGDVFDSGGRGQEFVMDAIPEIQNWAEMIIR